MCCCSLFVGVVMRTRLLQHPSTRNHPREKWAHGLTSHLLSARRFSRDRPRFNDTLDVIKFLCKDLWMLVFRKQIDNLKTNHRVRYAAFPLGTPDGALLFLSGITVAN